MSAPLLAASAQNGVDTTRTKLHGLAKAAWLNLVSKERKIAKGNGWGGGRVYSMAKKCFMIFVTVPDVYIG